MKNITIRKKKKHLLSLHWGVYRILSDAWLHLPGNLKYKKQVHQQGAIYKHLTLDRHRPFLKELRDRGSRPAVPKQHHSPVWKALVKHGA